MAIYKAKTKTTLPSAEDVNKKHIADVQNIYDLQAKRLIAHLKNSDEREVRSAWSTFSEVLDLERKLLNLESVSIDNKNPLDELIQSLDRFAG